MFRNPRPLQDEIIESYNAGIVYANWQGQLERPLLWQKRLDILRSYKDAGMLLDIGTGDGAFLEVAKDYFKTDSTEVSEVGAQYARERGHSPYIGDITALDFGDRTFDVITLWHVLEHLPFPTAALRKIRQLLNTDGILVIAVPNEASEILSHVSRRRKGSPFGMLVWGAHEIHLTHFTPKVLSSHLLREGFKILELGVDDVHLLKTRFTKASLATNRLISKIFKTHFEKAMYFVCAKSAG